MRTSKTYIALLVLLSIGVACKDQGPQGPNLIITNESAGADARVVLLHGTDTVFNRLITVGTKECTTLSVGEQVSGTVIISTDTLALTPFWAATNNNWADIVTLKAGPEVLQTRRSRDGC